MIKAEVYKHSDSYSLNKHIKRKIANGYKLISCSTRDIFWTFSTYLNETTLVWEI